MQDYQVVKAKTPMEALKKSGWQLGDAAEVISLNAIANTDGTFSIFASFGLPGEKKLLEFKTPRTCLNRP